jgi:hypothetical protein
LVSGSEPQPATASNNALTIYTAVRCIFVTLKPSHTVPDTVVIIARHVAQPDAVIWRRLPARKFNPASAPHLQPLSADRSKSGRTLRPPG